MQAVLLHPCVDDDSMDNSSTTRNAHNNAVPW